MPGEVTNLQCAGTLALLRDGACLARDAQNVFDELWTKLPTQVQLGAHATILQTSAPPSADAARLLQLLETGIRHLDTLTRDTGIAPAAVQQLMLRLELSGLVEALPGGAYSRRR